MKKVLFAAALLMGAATLSFAGTPKGDAKDNATPTTTVEKSNSGASLFWYKVSYDNPSTYPDGYIKSGAALEAHAEKASVNSPCDLGDTRECLRGFSTAQTAETGDGGTDQIMTDDPIN